MTNYLIMDIELSDSDMSKLNQISKFLVKLPLMLKGGAVNLKGEHTVFWFKSWEAYFMGCLHEIWV